MSDKITKAMRSNMDLILAQLEMGPQTLNDLTAATKQNYYSIRKAMVALQEHGLAKTEPFASHRNTRFMLSDANGPNRIVPILQINGQAVKASELVSLGVAKQVDAIEGIGPAICRLMAAAIRSNEGTPQPTEIARAKTALSQAEKELQKLLGLVQQFTTNERFWNADLLAKFPQDPDFNAELVAHNYQLHFASSED